MRPRRRPPHRPEPSPDAPESPPDRQAPPDPPKRRRRRTIALAVLATLALGAAGVALGLRLAGAETYTTPLGKLSIGASPAIPGEVDVYVPIADWGVRARAFDAPFRLSAEVRSIDRSGVLRAATGERAVLRRTGDRVDSAAASALVRATVFSAVGGLVVGLVATLAMAAFRRGSRWARLLLPPATALVAFLLAGGSALAARETFDPDALTQPRVYARGAELLQLLEAANRPREAALRYESKVAGSVSLFSRMLAGGLGGATRFAGPDEDARSAVLASDLHNNPLVLNAVEGLSGSDRPIFFAGDFGHEGNEGEARLFAPSLARLGPRVFAVSGNHDSAALMRRLARVGVTVLTARGRLGADGRAEGPPVIEAFGMRIAGYGDPLEWRKRDPSDPERIFSFPELPDGDRARSEAEEKLVAWFDGLPERPDLVLIHQNGLAQHLARTLHERGDRRPLVILAGHDHRQHVDRHGEVVVVDAGSVGAGGVLGAGREEVALAELHFRRTSAVLQAVDLIGTNPFTGDAQAERVIVEGRLCEDESVECDLADR